MDVRINRTDIIDYLSKYTPIEQGKLVESAMDAFMHISSNASLKLGINALDDRIGKSIDKIESLHQDLFGKIKTSSIKGKIGEVQVFDALKTHFEIFGHSVEMVSDVGHTCDICIETVNNKKIFVEVKWYERNVPTKEVEKFNRDLLENRPDGAVFLSLNSGICKKKNAEITQVNGIPVIYICNTGCIPSIWIVVVSLIINLLNRDSEDAEVKIDVQAQIIKLESLLKMIASMMGTVQTMETSLSRHKKDLSNLEKNVGEMITNMIR